MSLTDLSSIAQGIAAVVNIALVWYIFVYQRQKDKNDQIRVLLLQAQSVKLQWFKDLIVAPNTSVISQYYEDVAQELQILSTTVLTDPQKSQLTNRLKASQSRLRRSFVNLLAVADPAMEVDTLKILDDFTDCLTVKIFDQGINLTHPPTFEKEISKSIVASKVALITKIYSFQGN